MNTNEKWLIWSNEHNAWWGKNCRGYVQNVKDAGRYPYAQAIEIVRGANIALNDNDTTQAPNEAMVLDTLLGATKPIPKEKCIHSWQIKGKSGFLSRPGGRPMTTYYCERCLAETDR